MKRLAVVLAFLLSASFTAAHALEEYAISGSFDGCEYGKFYELVGGGVLECREYNYFYEYNPRVIADGRDVLFIGDERTIGFILDGGILYTQVSGEFDGCDYDKTYILDNGLLFVCRTYSYTYSYRPDVKIVIVKGRDPVVLIDDEEYDGDLYRSN